MTRRKWVAGAFASSALALAAGCGGSVISDSAEPDSATKLGLREVGEMYRSHAEQYKFPPRSGADLDRYAPAFSSGSMALVNRQVEVAWGAPIEPGSVAVLAFEKGAGKSGGLVLLQDGETIKSLNADEFKAAPRAKGK